MKPFLIPLCAFVLGYGIAAGVDIKSTSYTQDMKDAYGECKLGNATVAQCDNMMKIWVDAMTAPSSAVDRCDAARLAAMRGCIDGYEDRSYVEGEVTYRPSDRAKDFPRCRQIGSAAFYACHNY